MRRVLGLVQQPRWGCRALVALGAALVAACSTGTEAPAQSPMDDVLAQHPEIPASAIAVDAQALTVVTSPISQIEARTRSVLRSQEAWAHYWNAFHGNLDPSPPVPTLDFDSRVVVVAAMGQRTSGGYANEIEGTFEADGVLWVAVAETRPGALCMTTGALTAPATAAQVTSTATVVRFTERSIETDCS